VIEAVVSNVANNLKKESQQTETTKISKSN